MPVLDAHNRPLANLRLSVTDRCNLRCQYCMPEEDYLWLPREDILQFEEIERLVDQFLLLGVDKVRLTGGEPLLRRDLPALIEPLARKSAIRDLAMTTNAVLLKPAVNDLKAAGLHRLTISLDTLQRDRFIKLARFDELPRVLAGIDAAVDPFPGFKIDTVVIRGVNDDEIVRCSISRRRAARRFASSNTWTLAAPRRGRCRRSCRARTCSRRSRRTTVRSSRCANRRLRPPIATACQTARSSGSSRRRPNRSANRAIAAG